MFTLEERDVVALFSNDSRSLRSIGLDIAVKSSIHFKAHFWKDSEIIVGWIPFSSNFCAADNKLPAITTTDVVPSPASISCAFDNSTSWN